MTRKSIIIAGTALLLAPGSTTAWAQSAKPAAAAKVGTGAGTITALDTRAGTVTIKHGAIPAIGWPAMTMTFRASPPTLLKNLRTGQRVGFTAKAQGMNAEVTAIRPQ
ncbi:copper-binding protein [Sphingomonas sp. CCH5-D11]|uniref:copper-binding protein n=1 Tax=Sphingomonas sp. CCH5-D11 TaxID=1768786 RepID=UPI00083731BB|nr:copper-binding protein [Sphingomonas sp. CCH5-D11]